MAVVIETTLGDITVDLYLDQRPVTCLNFLKLCKMKYYNYSLFHTIRSGFIAQTGDPSGEGSGGQSVWGLLEGPDKRFFSGEKMPKIRHTDAGLLSMVCTDDMMVGSQFFFTLAPDLDSLDGVHCVIGEVTEGHEILTKLNEVICDETHRPYQDVRITHTVVLEDPFNDPPGLRAPSRSPSPNPERLKGGRIAPDEEIDERQGKSNAEIQEMIEEKEAKARATILEIVGDLPDADIAPPENVLFVCKLNPVTSDEDLEIIFSRFGKIVSCEVIRDKKTGDSLQYAFIEFDNKESCEEAYFKMDNVLIDDRRIHVDFSQSVSKMRWLGKGRGVKYFNDNDVKNNHVNRRSHSRDRQKDNSRNRINHYNKDFADNRKSDRDSYIDKRDQRVQRDRRERSRSISRSKLEKEKYSREWGYREERKRNVSESESKSHISNKTDKNNHSRQKLDTYEKTKYLIKNDKDLKDKKDKHEKTNSLIKNDKNLKENKDRHEKNYDRKREIKESENNNSHRSRKSDRNNEGTQKIKQKEDKNVRTEKNSTKTKNDEQLKRVKTPSPIRKTSKDRRKNSKIKEEKELKKKKTISDKKKGPRKRKQSTSSSDSSSSSSSDSSSSSGTNHEKKRSKRRKRKHSTSSSSTSSDSSSTTSSSSSDSSTDSSSSSSESEPRRKRKKTGMKKFVNKKK